MDKEVDRRSDNTEIKRRIAELESHAIVIRGLISYHTRALVITDSFACSDDQEKGCPKVNQPYDPYREALVESLRLIQKEIAVFKESK